MKPTKNRVFCKDCGRSKMLFETDKKAETFIKFNSSEIEEYAGYKPERCYFCTYCGGWHVTSQKEYLVIKSRTEKILDLYEQEKEQKALMKAKQNALSRGQKALLAKAEKGEKVNIRKSLLERIDDKINKIEAIQKGRDLNDWIKLFDSVYGDFEYAKTLKIKANKLLNIKDRLDILSKEMENSLKKEIV